MYRKDKNTYKTLCFFYRKNTVELILKYYHNEAKQILLNKIKYAAVLRTIRNR